MQAAHKQILGLAPERANATTNVCRHSIGRLAAADRQVNMRRRRPTSQIEESRSAMKKSVRDEKSRRSVCVRSRKRLRDFAELFFAFSSCCAVLLLCLSGQYGSCQTTTTATSSHEDSNRTQLAAGASDLRTGLLNASTTTAAPTTTTTTTTSTTSSPSVLKRDLSGALRRAGQSQQALSAHPLMMAVPMASSSLASQQQTHQQKPGSGKSS